MPLHHATVNQTSSDAVVRALLDAYSEGGEEKDTVRVWPRDARSSPHSRLVLASIPPSMAAAWRAVTVLAICWLAGLCWLALPPRPTVAFCRVQDGNLPLHHAAKHKASEAVVRVLLDAHPNGATESNKVHLGDAPPSHPCHRFAPTYLLLIHGRFRLRLCCAATITRRSLAFQYDVLTYYSLVTN